MSTSISARSSASRRLTTQPRRKRIAKIRPIVVPKSVTIPVTCVVRQIAPKCIVHMPFCKPQAAARKYSEISQCLWQAGRVARQAVCKSSLQEGQGCGCGANDLHMSQSEAREP